jgi:hypothetical protein
MTRPAMLSFALVLGVAIASAQSAKNIADVAGPWTGVMDGLPGVRLVVQENDHKLTGAVLFFLIHRDPGAAPTASAGFPEPMLDPSFDGKVLSFKVNHRYAHPPGTLNDPPVSFRLEITGPDQAKLFSPELPPLEMTREKFK